MWVKPFSLHLKPYSALILSSHQVANQLNQLNKRLYPNPQSATRDPLSATRLVHQIGQKQNNLGHENQDNQAHDDGH